MRARAVATFLVLVCFLAVPLRLSDDAWAYAAYGALLGDGRNPWGAPVRTTDVSGLHDPVLNEALARWGGSLPRNVYGPLFTLPCALLVAAARPLGAPATVLLFRLAAAGAFVGCIALARRTRPALAGLLALHPVALWAAAEGHNDVYWLGLVLLADRAPPGRARLAVLDAAAAVKAVALVPLAGALVALRRGHARGALVAAAALAVAYAPLLIPLAAHGLDPRSGLPRLSLLHAGAIDPQMGALAGALALLAAAVVLRILRDGERLGALAVAGWAALPAPEPWYALWLVPAAAALRPGRARRALVAASYSGVLLYLQDAAGTALHQPALLGGTMLGLYGVPLLIALLPSPAPAPQPSPAAQPTAAVTAAPAPAASTTPLPAPVASTTPAASPAAASSAPGHPAPSPSTSPFGYIVSPTPPPASGPRIVEIALNDRVMHKGGMLLVRVTTTTDVTGLIARTMGQQIAIPQMAPGVFAGQQQLPGFIPFWLLNRNYDIQFVATASDGRTATANLPIRLER